LSCAEAATEEVLLAAIFIRKLYAKKKEAFAKKPLFE